MFNISEGRDQSTSCKTGIILSKYKVAGPLKPGYLDKGARAPELGSGPEATGDTRRYAWPL